MKTVLGRDGHVLELAVYGHLLGELGAEQEAALAAHLADCEPCRARVEAARSEVAAPLPAMPAVDPIDNDAHGEVITLSSWRRVAAVVVAGAALAAGTALVVQPPGGEQFTARGQADWFEVYRSDGAGVVRVGTDDRVGPGDRLGFRVDPGADGRHLLIFGLDDRGALYPAWPAGSTPASAWLAGSEEPAALETAVQLDAAPGSERLVALACPSSLDWEALARAVAGTSPVAGQDLPALFDHCEQAEVRLTKAAP